MEIGDESIGYIYIFRTRGAAFSPNDQQVLSAFADQAAIAVNNARLYQQVSAERERLNAIVENSGDGVMIVNPYRIIQTWNKTLANMTGISVDQAVGRPCYEILDLLGRLNEGDELTIVAKNDTGEWWQVEYRTGENDLVWLAKVVVNVRGDASAVPVTSDNSTTDETAMPEATTTPIPVEPIIFGSVEAIDPINVRSEPSTAGLIMGGLYPGEVADVLAQDDTGEWWHIEFVDGLDGLAWVSAEFVRFTGEPISVPIFGIGTVTPTPGPTNTPTSTPTPTASPTIVLNQPTFAPTATSLYQATSAAILADRDPTEAVTEAEPAASASSFSWDSLPWGILAILLVAIFIWYQFVYHRSRQ